MSPAAADDASRKALLAIKRLRAQLAELQSRNNSPIAIVGMACRFPGAPNAEAYRDLLMEGREGMGPIPTDRWDADSFYDPDPDAPGKIYVRQAGFLDDIAGFDSAFFGLPAREAEFMDPQQRLLLEQTWHALEHARIRPDSLDGSDTGVFVGITQNDYAVLMQAAIPEPGPYFITGNALNAAAGRISYLLRLNGPAMAIDTACSSSLVAIHQACLCLRAGEADLAIAAGVNTIVTPMSMMATCRARMLSPDGRCKTFDKNADGYARGEGCAVLILKRLDDAIRDEDRILAVIQGSAVNQNGRSSGLTVPSTRAQQQVIEKALASAGITPDQVDFLECHGTGTSLGDPIELQAANAAYAPGHSVQEHPLLIGSAKTNIGHLEAAAGIAGLIKCVIALQETFIPPHRNMQTPNPHVPWDELCMRVVTSSEQPWPRSERFAAVSSFGFSGTNAHVILTTRPQPAPAAGATLEHAAGTPLPDLAAECTLRGRPESHGRSLCKLVGCPRVGSPR